MAPTRIRCVTHLDVDADGIERALAAFREVAALMRKLIVLGVVVLALLVNTVVTDRETKAAEASGGGKIVELAGRRPLLQGGGRARRPGDRPAARVRLLAALVGPSGTGARRAAACG